MKSNTLLIEEELQKLRTLNTQLQRDLADALSDAKQARRETAQLQESYDLLEQKSKETETKMRLTIKSSLREHQRLKSRITRQKANENSLRLASLTVKRKGIEFVDSWQEGFEFVDIQEKLKALARQREDVDKSKRSLTRRHRHSKSNDDQEDEIMMQQEEEVAKLQLLSIKREETEILARLDRLLVERTLHIKECIRIRNEDDSRFNSNPVLNDRYLLLELIDRGGFSEVFRAFDLHECRVVACKINSLSDQWSEEHKRTYIRHSIRDYHIQKSLDHANIVKLFDVFDYDHASFCTILEYVEGQNLETILAQLKSFTEKEARSIIVQIVSALKYLNTLENPVVHYDLKPGNILISNGHVKITDFGLSKIMDKIDQGTCAQMRRHEADLTSQGAGTYWYLPPEVFDRSGPGPIKISSKVDVWSLGCILFEMLYGVKPFGHNKSQASILHESTIVTDALSLTFPPKPSISVDAKEFLKRCLEYHKDRRPDVIEISMDKFVVGSSLGNSKQTK
eukprot:jgi/Hompol1/5624/HPOL_000862-RA